MGTFGKKWVSMHIFFVCSYLYQFSLSSYWYMPSAISGCHELLCSTGSQKMVQSWHVHWPKSDFTSSRVK